MRSDKTANHAIDAVVTFFNQFAAAQRGFYTPHMQNGIVVQPIELDSGKKTNRSVSVVAVLAMNAAGPTASSDLIAKAEQIQQAIVATKQGANNALNGMVIEFIEVEAAKIIAPESHDPNAKALFTLTIKF